MHKFVPPPWRQPSQALPVLPTRPGLLSGLEEKIIRMRYGVKETDLAQLSPPGGRNVAAALRLATLERSLREAAEANVQLLAARRSRRTSKLS
jgi:hypothetical protein